MKLTRRGFVVVWILVMALTFLIMTVAITTQQPVVKAGESPAQATRHALQTLIPVASPAIPGSGEHMNWQPAN